MQVADWLLAESELALRYPCWHSQQAAEKVLKALLLLETGGYKPAHDLHDLADLLPEPLGGRIPRPGLSLLTQLYIESRYPGRYAEPTSTEALTAMTTARAVFDAVNGEFQCPGVAAQSSSE